MNELLLEVFRHTTYHVVLDPVRWAAIHIDSPVPAELAAVVGSRPWGFITAWNPQARRQLEPENRAAQQTLLDALGKLPQVVVHPAIGVGQTGWAEPSLFVIGADVATLDALMHLHDQLAYVHGLAGGPAVLRMQCRDAYIDIDPAWLELPKSCA